MLIGTKENNSFSIIKHANGFQVGLGWYKNDIFGWCLKALVFVEKSALRGKQMVTGVGEM